MAVVFGEIKKNQIGEIVGLVELKPDMLNFPVSYSEYLAG